MFCFSALEIFSHSVKICPSKVVILIWLSYRQLSLVPLIHESLEIVTKVDSDGLLKIFCNASQCLLVRYN